MLQKHSNIYNIYYKIYKFSNGMPPKITNKILPLKEINHYNFRHPLLFIVPLVYSVYIGTESTGYLGPKIWEIISSEIKKMET